MKRKGMLVLIVMIFLISILIIFLETTSLYIIGGADGPTRIFIASKLNHSYILFFILLVGGLTTAYCFLKKNKNS